MTRLGLTTGIATLTLLLMPTVRSQVTEARADPSPPTVAEIENIRLQREKLELDKEKYKSDVEHAERAMVVEKSKAFWSAITTGVPLVVGVIAIVAGFWNQHQQAKHQFELKAAEIIFSATTPQAVLTRGKALKTIFGNKLAKDFLRDFKPENIGGFKEPSAQKLAFLEQVLKNPQKKREIVELWFRLFPGDYKWLFRIDPESFKNSNLPEIKELFATLESTSRAILDPQAIQDRVEETTAQQPNINHGTEK